MEENTEENLIVPTHEQVTAEDLHEIIQSKDIKKLREYVQDHDAVDIATAMDDMSDVDILFLFKTVSSEYTAEIFSYMDSDDQQKVAESLSSSQVQDLIKELSTDDLVDFVEDLPANLIKKILDCTGKDDINRRVTVNAFLHFEKDTAGSIMTTEFVEIKSGATVKEALAKIKKVGRDAETIDTTFVIDSSRHLIGTLNLDELIFAEEDTIVDTIMDDDYVSTVTSTDQEEIGELFKKYDLHVMPVVNKDHRLIGIITIDDIMDVMEDEATEDIQKMAGTSPIDTPYLKTSVLKIAKSRIVWLLVLMISATFTSLIINKFESVLSVVPVLSVFIPMLMDTSGNAGNQTTTTITRALGIGDVDTSDYFKILFKEFRVSLITGFIVALFNFLWIFIELKTGIISNSTDGLSEWRIALQVAITLYIVIIFAKCLGASLPILAKKLHLDPALMAGPLITTIIDALSLLTFFLLAKVIIGL